MIDLSQPCDLPDRRSKASELIRPHPVWDVVFTELPGQEGFSCVSFTLPLKKNAEHEVALVHSPPQPMSNPVHRDTHFVQTPPGAPPWLPVA